MLRRQLVTGLMMTIAMVVLVGLIFPLAVTGVSQLFFNGKANGSLVTANGKVVGSSLIGQNFSDKDGSPLPRYLQPRPSNAGAAGYDALASGASNLGPSNPNLLDEIARRTTAYRAFNGLAAGVNVPADAVTASGSGLDPHISLANARLQAPRIAKARSVRVERVQEIINSRASGRQLGFLGEQTVNVLDVNLALDRLKS